MTESDLEAMCRERGTLFDTGTWLATRDGDPRAFALFRRHYSYREYADGRRAVPNYRNRFIIIGPGEKLPLVTPAYDALFCWRRFKDDCTDANGVCQTGVNCSVFRNESQHRSSDMILAAEELAWRKWPGERLYTYVNAAKTSKRRGRHNPPGWCFICAGWRECGATKSGLVILEKLP